MRFHETNYNKSFQGHLKKTDVKYLLFILLVYNQLVNAQDTLNAKLVEPFSYNFHIENKRFDGKGADSLISEIQKSHFVLIGETHDDAKIVEFTDILLSVPKKKELLIKRTIPGLWIVLVAPN